MGIPVSITDRGTVRRFLMDKNYSICSIGHKTTTDSDGNEQIEDKLIFFSDSVGAIKYLAEVMTEEEYIVINSNIELNRTRLRERWKLIEY